MDRFLVRAGTSSGPEPDEAAKAAAKAPVKAKKTCKSASTGSTKKRKKPVSKESTVQAWGLGWIRTTRDDTTGTMKVYCIACRTYQNKTSRNNRGSVTTDPYITGTSNTKKFAAMRHGESVGHKGAYDSWKNDTRTTEPIVKAVTLMDEQAFNKMVKLFDIAYHLAKHELPFSYFPSLCNLEKRHGVDLGSTYLNPIQAHTFTEFLAEDIRSGVVDSAIKDARYISILIDGSTDRSSLEKELMYIKYLEDGIPCTRFFGLGTD